MLLFGTSFLTKIRIILRSSFPLIDSQPFNVWRQRKVIHTLIDCSFKLQIFSSMYDLLLLPGYKRLSISEKTGRQCLQFETLNSLRSSLYNHVLDIQLLSYYMQLLNVFLYFIFKTNSFDPIQL